MRWRVGLVLLVIAAWGGCAKQEPEPSPNITAERLGESTAAFDDDADDAAAMDELDPHPDDSVWAGLTPAERQALSDQGYEIHIDEADREALRAEQEQQEEEANKGAFGRAMDHVGRASLSVAAVAISVGMMVAPFFLM
jgi:hypothetical protein